MPRILGITGNIACGKTAVGKLLLAMGVERYIDADAVVLVVSRPDGKEETINIEPPQTNVVPGVEP